ncbi:MAG: phosphate ABC transporter substrate-binding protein PstS [Elusimicrobia bacterium RIFCSPLOWO2_01_FULL_64_13]|nr:MAG: phosphate ABC transporter substrate-binding protein PstS [Elusimicrobia bacterium RIFCSPLOWO2_01_FULL_64_13]
MIRRKQMKRFISITAAAGLLLGLTATAKSAGGILINGAGATFPYPIYSKWFDEYHKLRPEYKFNYQSIGSGGGIRQITAGTVDFGASDGPMTDSQMESAPGYLYHIPTVLGAVVPTYNIEGVGETLNFTPKALAGIFLGSIKTWDHPEIKSANPGASIPSKPIVVVHRSDGSGTTYIWVDYLAKISPEWAAKVGRGTSVAWPVGLGGKGNEGVAGLVKQTPNSIGYVELIYAKHNDISYGKVRNKAGKFVAADLDSVSAAARAKMPSDFRVSITDSPDPEAYPASGFTWLLVYRKQKDPVKGKALVDFLNWMLEEGQKSAGELGYAPLPPVVNGMVRNTVRKIEVK